MLKLSEFAWKIRSLVWFIFNNFLLIDATDKSKIISDQKSLFFAVSLYPLSFFANTSFNARVSNRCAETRATVLELRSFQGSQLCASEIHLRWKPYFHPYPPLSILFLFSSSTNLIFDVYKV